jgi:A/G-specific adenine glycosylase
MPWRNQPEPYAIWISEIMLQQTQVDTATPYYKAFMRQFPNVKALAAAEPQDVLKAWEGLGYYSRARNLQSAARMLVAESGGQLPRGSAELRKLPGIGEYTAAAIASIAHGEPVPSVDGNVLRVVSRFRGSVEDVSKSETRAHIREYLARHIRRTRPGDFNQALMELGALVCRPRNPDCGACPLNRNCVARRERAPERYPVKTALRPPKKRDAVAGLLCRKGRLLMSQRPEGQLLGGLWEFPGGWRVGREGVASAAKRAIGETTGLRVELERRLCVVSHAFTHIQMKLHVYACRRVVGRTRMGPESQGLRWVAPREIRDLPLTKATHKVLAALGDEDEVFRSLGG